MVSFHFVELVLEIMGMGVLALIEIELTFISVLSSMRWILFQ